MKTVDELVRQYQADALTTYYKAFKSARSRAVERHIIDVAEARFNAALPDSNVYVHCSHMSIFLYGDDNVAKSVELALEEHKDILMLLGAKEFIEQKWNGDDMLEYVYDDYSINVHIGGSRTCSRVKIGTKSRTVTEDVYDIVCN